jgi:drug/metabolite transporter (DMT)-like permease
VSLPTLQVAWLLAEALVIHFGYNVTMALSYERAAYTVVYPIVRGTGPLVTVLAASVMLATRSNKVGGAVVLRETSTVFAALIAWLILGEHVGKRRAALMALVALGAVIVEMGG